MRKRERLIFSLSVEAHDIILIFRDKNRRRFVVGRLLDGEYVGWSYGGKSSMGHSAYAPENLVKLLILHAFPITLEP